MSQELLASGESSSVCQQFMAGKGFEEGARNYTEITLILFAVNLGLIFTGRFIVRENPYQINILGKTVYEFEHRISQKTIKHIDRILFTINFALISILTMLQFVPFGKIVQG